MTVGDRTGSGQAFDGHIRVQHFGNVFGHLVETLSDSRGSVEDADTAMGKTQPDEAGDIIYQDVVADFLSIAEQRDFAILECCSEEAIWAVAVVGIGGAINGTGANDAEGCFGFGGSLAKNLFARDVHQTVEV